MKPISSILALSVFGFTAHAAAAALQHKPLEGLPLAADGQVFDDDWNRDHWEAAGARFTGALRRKFPVGSPEAVLVDTLVQQGFKFPPPAKPGCVSEEQRMNMPVGKSFVPCPTYDSSHLLRFVWTPHQLPVSLQAGCSQTVGVMWTAKDGELISIRGYYGNECV